MKAAITLHAGSPSVIEIQETPKPKTKQGWIVTRIKAFGLNRSELFTSQGDSPGVQFPITQGIECVGLVEEDVSETYQPGQKVAAIMGGMEGILMAAMRNMLPSLLALWYRTVFTLQFLRGIN